MNLAEVMSEALISLTNNKLRSLLTVLGIVIGVAAVIAMVSLGRGVQESVNSQFSGIGATSLTIFYSPDASLRNPQPLTLADAAALADPAAVTGVMRVSASISNSGVASYGNRSVSTTFYGTTANYATVNGLKLAEGRFLSEEDNLGQTSVAVLGARAARKIFERERGITGELIRLEGQPYRVVGVLAQGSGVSFGTGAGDDSVLVPLSTAQARLIARPTRTWVDSLNVQIASASQIDRASEQIKQVLRIRHRTPVGVDDFFLFAPKALLDAFNQVAQVLTVFLGGVAAISLLVGGIGIMNIMLVSVTERTREIGLRKAIGASKRDILVQFLAESALLSLVGGVIGILLGWLVGVAIRLISSASGTAINPQIGLDVILLATLFSSAIGIFFGFYPANRAANLMPVEALRAE